jgi:hypothetical protein
VCILDSLFTGAPFQRRFPTLDAAEDVDIAATTHFVITVLTLTATVFTAGEAFEEDKTDLALTISVAPRTRRLMETQAKREALPSQESKSAGDPQ